MCFLQPPIAGTAPGETGRFREAGGKVGLAEHRTDRMTPTNAGGGRDDLGGAVCP